MSEQFISIDTNQTIMEEADTLMEEYEQQKIDQLNQRVKELEASNAELLGVLEDFMIDVEGYFGFSETDDMEPEDDVAYFIGEYCRAKRLIKKGQNKERDQNELQVL